MCFDIKKLLSSHSRTLNIQKNILVSVALKGISIGTNLLMVPLMLKYLDSERYGLWLTLSSIIGWFLLFDVGLGNGLRNKFAEAIAVRNIQLARTYVSTTFVILAIIMFMLIGVFLAVNPILNWNKILNTQAETKEALSVLALVIFVFFVLQLIFKLTTSVLLADQKSALVDLIHVIGQVLCLAAIAILLQIGQHSLFLLVIALSACPLLVLVAAYFFVFTGKYKQYKPSLKYVNIKHSKVLLGVGFSFFFIQICSLLVNSTSNIVIAQVFSSSEVVIYNIAFKYFSVLTLLFGIIMTPFWSAFTEAYTRHDIKWIKNMIQKLILLWFIVCFGAVIMVLSSDFVYKIWIGTEIVIPIHLTITMACYVCIGCWNSIFYIFNVSVSKMFIQIGLSLIAGLTFIPLAFILSRQFGLASIPVAKVLAIIIGSFIVPIQYNKLINGKASGIWNK